jgi:WD40 repeat protein
MTVSGQSSSETPPQVTFTPDGRWLIQAEPLLVPSPTGRYLAHCPGNGEVQILDMRSQKYIERLLGPWDYLYTLAWHPSEMMIALAVEGHRLIPTAKGAEDDHSLGVETNSIELWDRRLDQRLATLSGHTAIISALLWQPGGEYLISASYDGRIMFWRESTALALPAAHSRPQAAARCLSPKNFIETDIFAARALKVWRIE